MTMIERVARALCWANGMNPDLTLGGDGQNFLWMEYERPARAAIKAMFGPTEGMMQAGEEDRWDGQVDFVWNAMVREALKPPATLQEGSS